MSMSIALRPYALMAFWYAAASSPALPQELSSLLPLHPPNDGITSPPALRTVLIVCWSTPPVSGLPPSHCGLQ